ncbi:hypothetical protein GCM10020256_12260 [Streptomyces thermocoprophilus]
MTTIGVEEEYLLLDPVTGLPVPVADKVRSQAGPGRLAADQEVHSELLQAQVEVATPVCGSLEEVGGHLLRLRHAVEEAAEAHSCRIGACGTPPLRHGHPVAVTDRARYRALRAQAPQLVAEQLVNGMHVHVGVPSRDTAVEVLNRIRVWLPTLTALSANSPLWDGHDTGFASWRTVIFGRWPVSGMPPAFRRPRRPRPAGADPAGQRSGRGHRPAVLARPALGPVSHRRGALLRRAAPPGRRGDDHGPGPGPRGDGARGGRRRCSPLDCDQELLQAAMWHAARHGLSSTLVDPGGGSAGPARCCTSCCAMSRPCWRRPATTGR